LEKALLNLPRESYFCIEDFDLQIEVPVTFTAKGEYITKCDENFLTTEPVNLVVPYLIRTVFHSSLKVSNRMAAYKLAAKASDKQRPFDQVEFQKNLPDWMRDHQNNIFNVSTFQKEYLYQYYCKATEDVIHDKQWKKSNTLRGFPEQYQVVMVASQLLKSVFEEECFCAKLISDMKRKEDEYKEVFEGGLENALPLVHYLEGRVNQLPVGAKIPQTEFRRVINNNLASVASFLAFSAYDQLSFHCLLVLLMKQTSETIPGCTIMFPSGLSPLVEGKGPGEQYLFQNERLDDGADFVKNVVGVLIRFGDYLKILKDDPFQQDKNGRVYHIGRIRGLLFRTLASDVVEIYVSHGCYPNCTKDCQEKHPWLMELLETEKESHTPVPLLLEYIILAIMHGKVKVAASHVYNRQNNLVSTTLNNKNIAPEGQESATTASGRKRPLTRSIRYYYQLVGAQEYNRDLEKWLTLTEVVNVILLGYQNPWRKSNMEAYNKVDWVPNFPEGTKIQLWINPNSESNFQNEEDNSTTVQGVEEEEKQEEEQEEVQEEAHDEAQDKEGGRAVARAARRKTKEARIRGVTRRASQATGRKGSVALAQSRKTKKGRGGVDGLDAKLCIVRFFNLILTVRILIAMRSTREEAQRQQAWTVMKRNTTMRKKSRRRNWTT
jgi:hypothetical protein